MKELYDSERRRLAQEYNNKKDSYRIYKFIFNLFFWILFFALNVGQEIYQNILIKLPWLDLKLLSFIIIIYFLYSSLSWILNYLLFYQLDKEYNLSNQSKLEWIIDKLKMSLLNIIIFHLVGRAFLTFSNYFGELWWIPFAGAGVLFTIILNFLFPVVIFPIFFEVTPYPDGLLRERLMNLFNRANVQVDDIYEFDLSSKRNSANAAVMGMGQTRKIILGDNLTDKYSNDEIEAVLAHEIGHHAHNDIFKLLFLQLGDLLITTSILSVFWEELVIYLGYSDPYSIVVLPLLMIGLGFLSFLINPIKLFWQRKTEERADDFALDLIDKPAKLGTSLAKLADESLVKLDLSLYKLLFKASHPPIAKRVEKSVQWSETKESGG